MSMIPVQIMAAAAMPPNPEMPAPAQATDSAFAQMLQLQVGLQTPVPPMAQSESAAEWLGSDTAGQEFPQSGSLSLLAIASPEDAFSSLLQDAPGTIANSAAAAAHATGMHGKLDGAPNLTSALPGVLDLPKLKTVAGTREAAPAPQQIPAPVETNVPAFAHIAPAGIVAVPQPNVALTANRSQVPSGGLQELTNPLAPLEQRAGQGLSPLASAPHRAVPERNIVIGNTVEKRPTETGDLLKRQLPEMDFDGEPVLQKVVDLTGRLESGTEPPGLNKLTTAQWVSLPSTSRQAFTEMTLPEIKHVPLPDRAQHELVNRVAETVSQVRNADTSQLTLRLKPEALGEIKLELVADRDGLRAHLQAQSSQVLDILEKHLPKLREALQEQGVQLSDLQLSSEQQSGRGQFRDGAAQRSHSASQELTSTVEEQEASLAEADGFKPAAGRGISLRI